MGNANIIARVPASRMLIIHKTQTRHDNLSRIELCVACVDTDAACSSFARMEHFRDLNSLLQHSS
jgi:hypothetical protein